MADELTIKRGDTRVITVTVTDSNGSPFDLTDYKMFLTAKTDRTNTDANADIGPKEAVIASPLTGVGVITLSSDDTDIDCGLYYYDVQVNKGSTNVYTIIWSTITMQQDVTKTNT